MEQTVFEIGGVEYNVVKRGLAQAQQVAEIGRWLAIYGAPAIRAIQDNPDFAEMGGMEVVTSMLGTLSGESLVELYSLVFGCPMEVANEYFDIAQMVDGIISLYENQPSIKRLVGRFFGAQRSQSTGAGNFMQSE